MNNNLIEFKNKYLKYKYKYITLKNQSFSTYNTKFKQIGGSYDFVCVIDDDGPFASVRECYDKLSSAAAPPPAAALRPVAASSASERVAALRPVAARKAKSEAAAPTPLDLLRSADEKFLVHAQKMREAQEAADKDSNWNDDDNKYLKYKHKYLKYKHKYITLKNQLFSTYNTKITQIGGAANFVCVIDSEGRYENNRCIDSISEVPIHEAAPFEATQHRSPKSSKQRKQGYYGFISESESESESEQPKKLIPKEPIPKEPIPKEPIPKEPILQAQLEHVTFNRAKRSAARPPSRSLLRSLTEPISQAPQEEAHPFGDDDPMDTLN
jgi:hypothetical protein